MNAVFLPDLANSAVAREIRITEHGQSNAVLAADREAVEVFATLASSDSARIGTHGNGRSTLSPLILSTLDGASRR